MPKFKVEAQSKHSPEDTFQKIKTLLETDKELRSMDNSYICDFNAQKLSGTAKGGKFQADMLVSPKTAGAPTAGAMVTIEVSLPMLLTPLKGVVQSTLQKKLDYVLA
jgi:hypothetical protein